MTPNLTPDLYSQVPTTSYAVTKPKHLSNFQLQYQLQAITRSLACYMLVHWPYDVTIDSEQWRTMEKVPGKNMTVVPTNGEFQQYIQRGLKLLKEFNKRTAALKYGGSSPVTSVWTKVTHQALAVSNWLGQPFNA